jgi:hypothetical protein
MFQLNSSGALNWFSNPSPTPFFSNVVVDGSNNIYVFGYDSTNVQIIYSYTSSGTVRWGRRYTNASFATGTLMGATIDSSNNIYAIGLLGSSIGISRPSIGSTLKIDSNGNVLNSGSFYSPQQGSPLAYDTAGYCCAVDSSGNTYWGGEAQTSQYYTAKSTNYYLNNALVVKDTNAFQGAHAGNFTMNSYLSVAWNKTYPLTASSVSPPTIVGGGGVTAITSSLWQTSTITTVNDALSGGQPGIVAALVTI